MADSSERRLMLKLADRGGFEPPVRLPVRRISSAVLSTAQPPVQPIALFELSPSGQQDETVFTT